MNWSALLFPIWWVTRLKVVLTLLFFGITAYLLVVFNWAYSDGNRAGYLQKLSSKGWICKSHEGELAMTTVPGVAPILWNFSVWDGAVAHKMTNLMGKKIVLHYKEYRYLPTNCFGETTYFVDSVQAAAE